MKCNDGPTHQRMREASRSPAEIMESSSMDTSDIAAAALKPEGKGKCSCSRHTKDHKPHRACPKCKGKGTLSACLQCEGSGFNPAVNKPCALCGGRGYHLPETTKP